MDRLSQTQIQNYTLISKVGEGSSAEVILAKQKSSKSLCVLKMIQKHDQLDKIQKQRLVQEKQALLSIDHPFLIKIYQAFQTRKHFCLALEYCPGGDLYTHLHMSQRFTEEKLSFYAAQLILALEYLHEQNIIFRDLKPENILIGKDGYLKVIDFGMAKLNASQNNFRTFSICGTSEYTSPQILQKQGHGKQFDWWTLGCCLYELVYKISPFYSDDRTQMYEKILNDDPVFDQEISNSLKDLIMGLLEKNADDRNQFVKKIKSHQFFSQIDFQKLIKKQIPASYIPEYARGKKTLRVIKEEVQQFLNFQTCETTDSTYLQDFDYKYGEQKLKKTNLSSEQQSKSSERASTEDDQKKQEITEQNKYCQDEKQELSI